jgi:hypothetical protein
MEHHEGADTMTIDRGAALYAAMLLSDAIDPDAAMLERLRADHVTADDLEPEPDDGLVLIAGILYDAETLEEAEPDLEPEPTTWPAIGEPACWCGEPSEYHDPAGHRPDARRRVSSVSAADGMSQTVSGVEIVTNPNNGARYRQRRVSWTDTDGYTAGIGRLVQDRMTGPDSGRWWLDWATAAGWRLAVEAARRGWLEAQDHGPATYGHVTYRLPW